LSQEILEMGNDISTFDEEDTAWGRAKKVWNHCASPLAQISHGCPHNTIYTPTVQVKHKYS